MPSWAQKAATLSRSEASRTCSRWRFTLAMKKRSPAGKKIERLSKKIETLRRPPCQWRGTFESIGKRTFLTWSGGRSSIAQSLLEPWRLHRRGPAWQVGACPGFAVGSRARPPRSIEEEHALVRLQRVARR